MMKVVPFFMLSTLILAGCGGADGGSSDSSSVGKSAESVSGTSNSNANVDESNSASGGNSYGSNAGNSSEPDADNTDESADWNTGSDTTTDQNDTPIVPDSSDNDNFVEPESPVEPAEPVTPPQSNEFADLMLHAVNQARSQQQDCGGTMMPAVPALTWDFDLESAAFTHSSDMANANFMGHTGSNGSDPGDRISATGYEFNAWAENVAAGQKNIDAVMSAWMESPGHCKNIMNATVTQLGASFVENPDSRYGIYWTQVFARPR